VLDQELSGQGTLRLESGLKFFFPCRCAAAAQPFGAAQPQTILVKRILSEIKQHCNSGDGSAWSRSMRNPGHVTLCKAAGVRTTNAHPIDPREQRKRYQRFA